MRDFALREMQEDDLVTVLNWRNHINIRRYMYSSGEITLENHIKWFGLAKKNNKKHLLIYEQNGVACGFVGFDWLAMKGTLEWAIYVAPNSPKGRGMYLGQAALDYAFKKLKAHKVVANVLAFNARSIRFHEKLGFIREGILREHHYDGTTYHNVECMGLLEREWSAFNLIYKKGMNYEPAIHC